MSSSCANTVTKQTVDLSCFFFSSRRRHTRFDCDWSSDVCSSDLDPLDGAAAPVVRHLVGAPFDLNGFFAFAAAEPVLARVVERLPGLRPPLAPDRSEERRVGKECRSRWSPYH